MHSGQISAIFRLIVLPSSSVVEEVQTRDPLTHEHPSERISLRAVAR